MTRHNIDITSTKITSIGRGTAAAITLHGRVSHGPANTIGRNISFFLADPDIAFILSTLTAMPLYREVFRAIADELDEREAITNNPETAPVTRLVNKLDSLETRNRVSRIVTDIITAASLASG